MTQLYDKIGLNYADLRKPDARIAKRIDAALGDAITVLNVGAGAGSYEPEGRQITAVEPSAEMIRQRPDSGAKIIQGSAENLPFDDNSFDASMAVLTVHHWTDLEKGIGEMLRVTRNDIVILTFDPFADWFWLADYFPALVELDRWQMPQIAKFEAWFRELDVSPVPIPSDCTDGFLAAYWRRPEAYLDERIRSAMSSFSAIGGVSEGVRQLADDLENGEWHRRYGHLEQLDELDCGYRLLVGR
ncbi:MAG: class I SAM-dependent methyltransferase [Henriciella sp.]|nr:class I SAM-dependent methyltransferase [Henriciella sp.]